MHKKIKFSGLFSGMVVFGSQGTTIENKGNFASKVRKFAKMAVFCLSRL